MAAWAVASSVVYAEPTEILRGLTGEVTFTYTGDVLEASAQQDLSAPLVLRLERDGEQYTARFIGAVAGEYDLRSLLRFRDGSEPSDVQPLPVRVVSDLPDGAMTDLFDTPSLSTTVPGGYRVMAAIVAVGWVLVPIGVLGARWWMRRDEVGEAPEAPPPTLADQLRPLVTAASTRSLSVPERGRLEMLLHHYWRTRIAPEETDVRAALSGLRRHPEAGALLGALERWLHQREPRVPDQAELGTLLAPYAASPAMPDVGEVA